MVRINSLLKPQDYEPEEEMSRIGKSKVSVISENNGFGNSSIKGHPSINKSLMLQGTGAGEIISQKQNDEMLIIDNSFNSTSQKKRNKSAQNMFSQSRENRMEMQKIQNKVKQSQVQKYSNVSKSKKLQGLESQFFIGH